MIKNEEPKITSSSASSLVAFLSKGMFLGIGTYDIFQISKTSSYISAIAAAIIGIIPFAMIMYIIKKGKGEGIIETIEFAFGKKLGNIINILFSIFFFLLATVLLYNFISFIDINYMPETSKLYIGLFMIIILAYMISKGLNVISVASQMVVYVSIITYFIGIFGMLSSVNFDNLMPTFDVPILSTVRGASTIIGLSVLPCFLITLIGKGKVEDPKKFIKNNYKMYIIAGIELSTLFFLSLAVLGINLISINKYPEYLILTKVNILNIVKRVQNIIALQLSYNVIFLILMSLMYPFKNFERKIKKEKNKTILYFGISSLAVILSFYIFPNMTSANIFYINYLPTVLGVFLGVFLLIFFFRIMYINKKKNVDNIENV